MPKDLFPNSLLTKDSKWPEDKGDCVFDFNNVECPYGDKCFRNHVNNPKSSPSSAATNGSNYSPKMRAIETQMRQVVCAEGATAAGGGGVRHLQQQQ